MKPITLTDAFIKRVDVRNTTTKNGINRKKPTIIIEYDKADESLSDLMRVMDLPMCITFDLA